MKIQPIVNAVLDDLALVAASTPNEHMPKEDQVRCCVYAAIRPLFHVVCVERGYGSIDAGSRIECDLWASNPGSPPVWIEFKRCWDVKSKGWNPKPSEQKRDWEADRAKLRGVPTESERHFLLVGFFSFDPMPEVLAVRSDVIRNIREFHSGQLVHQDCREFRWPNGQDISHVAAWVWHWPRGVRIEGGATTDKMKTSGGIR